MGGMVDFEGIRKMRAGEFSRRGFGGNKESYLTFICLCLGYSVCGIVRFEDVLT